METDEQLPSENNAKENGESEKNGKSPEEETVSAPSVKHLEENELFSQYYLVDHICCIVLTVMRT